MTLKDLVIKYRADNGLSQRQFALPMRSFKWIYQYA